MFSFFKNMLAALCLCSITCSALAAEEKPIVWGLKTSPYVRKVLVVLEEKQIPYDFKETAPAKSLKIKNMPIPEKFLEVSPLGKIPAFEDSNVKLADSAVISAYLEKQHPKYRLYPKNPASYAKALWFEKYADTAMSDVIHTKIFMENVVKPSILNIPTNEELVHNAVQQELPVIFNYLEKALSETSGRYLVDDQFSIADIAVVNHFVSLKMAKIPMDQKQWPLLTKYVEYILQLPSFKKSMP